MTDKLTTAGGALLFAVIFGAVGVFAAWVILGTLYMGYSAQDWVLVKADVVSTTDGITYRYRVGDKEYTNDRAGTMMINSSEMDGGLYERAVAAKGEKKPITVYVNPDDPAQSVIDRSVNWQPLVFFVPFMLGFGGVGLGGLWAAFRAFVPAPPKRKQAGTGLGTLWIATLMWNAIAMPLAFMFVPLAIESGEWLALLVLIFPLIGLLMLWGALYGTWKAFFGLFKGQSKMPPYKGRPHVDGPFGGLDPNKKAKDLTPEEMNVVRGLVKKKPRMVESNPEVLREMEQGNGERPRMAGMVSAPLPEGASRRLAQEEAEEAAEARARGKLP